jgi:thiazole synthase
MNPTSDVLVVGGGAMGLAIAIDLRLRGATVTVLSRDHSQAALHAAAGMLAPGAEGLVPGSPMRVLCDRSLQLYPDWISKLEALSGGEAEYWRCGILAPHYASHTLHDAAAHDRSHEQQLDAIAIHNMQPGLSEQVVGGVWYAEEGQVNPRALAKVLWQAAENLGVVIRDGVTVTGWQRRDNRVDYVTTNQGDWVGDRYVLAGGAWSADLLPLQIQPVKGQLLALQCQAECEAESLLHQVLYGDRIYIVPRRDGRIVLGATSEQVGFTPGNTAAGVNQLLTEAIRLFPALKDLPIVESWWGFRPAATDELPILATGSCKDSKGENLACENLAIATGHHRNGILLMPITASLIADGLIHQTPDPLLAHFSWQRFQSQAE